MVFLYIVQNLQARNGILVADSGGTKTDWCYVNSKAERVYFTTESCHPIGLDKRRASIISNLEALDIPRDVNLYFFGAGCFRLEGQEKVHAFLTELGFTNSVVRSDLEGAARALNVENGWIGIAGTGSVLARVENYHVVEVRGGKGHLEGDEGSGYYFGKLLINQINQGNVALLNWLQGRELPQLSDKKGVAELVEWCIHVPESVKPVIESIHRENCMTFFTLYHQGIQEISMVGGYVSYKESAFREAAQAFGLNIIEVLNRPIQRLTDHCLNVTF